MRDALLRWLGRGPAVDEDRWIVLDVESSGLDAQRDRLLAIAGIGVHFEAGMPRVHPADSFEVVLRQSDIDAPPDKANILLHGIGVGAQRAGIEPVQALQAFEAWAGNAPRLGFHVAFDRQMIDRALAEPATAAALGPRPRRAWLDIEPLAAVLHPAVRARALDEWLAHFRIDCAVRHQAAADALATAELLLKLWPTLLRELPRPRFAAVVALAARRRWVQR
jgi:DNA polymerase III subunit epsilon